MALVYKVRSGPEAGAGIRTRAAGGGQRAGGDITPGPAASPALVCRARRLGKQAIIRAPGVLGRTRDPLLWSCQVRRLCN